MGRYVFGAALFASQHKKGDRQAYCPSCQSKRPRHTETIIAIQDRVLMND